MRTITLEQSTLATSDQRLVSTVTYLASLSSSSEKIDPMLDILRLLTAQTGAGQELSSQGRASLQALIDNLKKYLIYEDVLRSFTKETLEERLAVHLSQAANMTPRRSLTFGAVAIAALLTAVLLLVVPYTPSLTTRFLLASPAGMVVALLGTMWFYLSSLQHFKPALQRAYRYICIGIVVLGLFFVLFVITPLAGWNEVPLLKYGGLIILPAITMICIYWGLHLYAQLLGRAHAFMSRKLYLGSMIIAIAAGVVMAYVRPTDDPLYFGFAMISYFVLTTTTAFDAVIARHIYHHSSSSAYAAAQRWLFIFTLGVFVGSIPYTVAVVYFGELTGLPLSLTLTACAMPATFLLLYTGHLFKRATGH